MVRRNPLSPTALTGSNIGDVMQYRKKPVVVEAFQWRNNGADFMRWLYSLPRDVDRNSAIVETNGLSIQTLEGIMTASYEDYIICGTSNELYPCKPDVFADVYEPVLDNESVDRSGSSETLTSK